MQNKYQPSFAVIGKTTPIKTSVGTIMPIATPLMLKSNTITKTTLKSRLKHTSEMPIHARVLTLAITSKMEKASSGSYGAKLQELHQQKPKFSLI